MGNLILGMFNIGMLELIIILAIIMFFLLVIAGGVFIAIYLANRKTPVNPPNERK